MKVLFDHQIYNNQKYGGISRYFYELSKGLIKQGVEVENSITFSENEFTADKQVFNSGGFIPLQFKGRGKLKRYLNRKASERAIKKEGFDIFHPTYYDTYFLDKQILKKPLVVTFYDLIHEKFSGQYPEQLQDIEKVVAERKLLLKHAAKVIAISQSTKDDIISYYKVPEELVEVTHLASSMDSSNLQKNTTLGRYLLYVGNRAAYKNFTPFVQAVAPILQQDTTLKIVAAGGGAFNASETEFFTSLGIENQLVQKGITDPILADLYYNALAFIFPSLYEGFGIPVLEAFSCHCPAILSNISSLPEVGGSAALYMDPLSDADMREKVSALLNSSTLRAELIAKGLQQAKLFSWQTMADETLDIYKSVL